MAQAPPPPEGEAPQEAEDQAPQEAEDQAPQDAEGQDPGTEGTASSEANPSAPPPEPEVLRIPPYHLHEGLQTLETAQAGDDPTLDDLLGQDAIARLDGIDWEAPTSMLRGRWYLRPLLSLDALDHPDGTAWAARGGVALGRMWFTTGALPVQGGADVGLSATVPMGQATGYRLHAHALAGPWLGPLGIRVGPTLRADRSRWRVGGEPRLLLDDAVLAGGRAVLALDLGPVSPYVDVEPAWTIAGARQAPEAPALLPVLGTETRYGAGLTLQGPWLTTGLHVHWNETRVGGALQASLSFALRPNNRSHDGDAP